MKLLTFSGVLKIWGENYTQKKQQNHKYIEYIYKHYLPSRYVLGKYLVKDGKKPKIKLKI